jgi:hypothetical protein
MNKKKRDLPLAAVLEKYIASDAQILRGVTITKLEEIYHQVVGQLISKYTEKVNFDKDTGKLTIYVKSAPLKAELKNQTEKLVENMNEAIGLKVINTISIK